MAEKHQLLLMVKNLTHVLSASHILTHLILLAPCEGSTSIIPVLERRSGRQKAVCPEQHRSSGTGLWTPKPGSRGGSPLHYVLPLSPEDESSLQRPSELTALELLYLETFFSVQAKIIHYEQLIPVIKNSPIAQFLNVHKIKEDKLLFIHNLVLWFFRLLQWFNH